MSTDYLWDRTGADPEVERLESLLGPFRFDKPLRKQTIDQTGSRWLAIAAGLFVVASASYLLTRSPGAAWDLEVVQNGHARTGRMTVGQTLQTSATDQARLKLRQVGLLEIAPNSRVQILETGERRARFSLLLGSIRAHISAPPGNFAINTPSATAVDLGCSYTLSVDNNGDGLVSVENGWVAFQWRGREVFIPAGAACATTKQNGPAIPYFRNSSDEFQAALKQYELQPDSSALRELLACASDRDAFTLWHLIPRTSGADRDVVYARLAELAPIPTGVTRDGILRLDGSMMDAWWDSFGLDNTERWRKYKRPWSQ